MIGVALCFGFGLSWYALTDGRFFGATEIGPWQAWNSVGVPRPDPYTRAYIARSAGLELGASEGLRFAAVNDSDNRRLDRACSYRVAGNTPAARFWTLGAVDPVTQAPLTRPEAPPGFHSARLARANDGSVELHVGTHLKPRNWLELTGEGPFELVLTLYDTASATGTGGAVATLPAIVREECR